MSQRRRSVFREKCVFLFLKTEMNIRKGKAKMTENKIPYKIFLNEEEMPKSWYNLRADMKNKPAPMLNPATLEPVTKEDLAHVFCDELVDQELDETTPYIEIPQEIQDFYKMYRPSPLVRAYNLEKALDTPAKIYYKFEGNAPEYISRDLKECAKMVSELDEKMLSLNEAIQECINQRMKAVERPEVRPAMSDVIEHIVLGEDKHES